jgi:hypothetical protein
MLVVAKLPAPARYRQNGQVHEGIDLPGISRSFEIWICPVQALLGRDFRHPEGVLYESHLPHGLLGEWGRALPAWTAEGGCPHVSNYLIDTSFSTKSE